jgi:hypothetical protein
VAADSLAANIPVLELAAAVAGKVAEKVVDRMDCGFEGQAAAAGIDRWDCRS